MGTSGTSARILREHVIEELGGKCVGSECMWVDTLGNHGCDDLRCLQIDHKHGNGREAALIAGNTYQHYKEMLNDQNKHEKYQVLCANCNWIKRRENNETAGGSKPASEPLSASGRATYISRLRSMLSLLPTLTDADEIEKMKSQMAKLELRLGIDAASVQPGAKPRNCKKCGTPVMKRYWYCSPCSAEKKTSGDRKRKKQRLLDAVAAGRTPCRSCVIREAREGKTTCGECIKRK